MRGGYPWPPVVIFAVFLALLAAIVIVRLT